MLSRFGFPLVLALFVAISLSWPARSGEEFDPCDESLNIWHLHREARKRDAPPIDWLEGWWIADASDGARTNTLHLGGGEIVRNGYVEDMFPKIEDGKVFIHRAGEPDFRIVELRRDGDTLHAVFREGELAYRKAEQEEYEKALAESRIDIDAPLGFWVSGKIERPAYPYATLVMYKGQISEWPIIAIGSGFSLNFNTPALALLYGIFDLTPAGDVLLRGGFGLNDIILDIAMIDADTMRVRDQAGADIVFHRADEAVLKAAQMVKE